MTKIFVFFCFFQYLWIPAQEADSVRGGYGPSRNSWDLLKYDLEVHFYPNTQSIAGNNKMYFSPTHISETNKNSSIQFDLQSPLTVDSVFLNNQLVSKSSIKQKSNGYFVPIDDWEKENTLSVYYHGTPKVAKTPPWDGGLIWSKDTTGKDWISIACQGLGASVWFPCKDSQYDEPQNGVEMTYFVPKGLKCVSNGKMVEANYTSKLEDKFVWRVINPINNYCMIPYIGDYVNIHEHTKGENGMLELDYWVLRGHEEKAKQQFAQVPKVIEAMEYWFGPYPFYEDGYQLVEAPHLGMEHQSAVAYGNGFKNGYLGKDLSQTGVGLLWDFIIVHESGHEWFGNNITSKDIADMWIHESFTAYSETLFTEYFYGKKKADRYVIGTRANIQNDIPIIGKYLVQLEGSGDMYYKGANMLHTIRTYVNNDTLFRCCLRKINQEFRHQTVTSKEIESFMSKELRMDLSAIFNQYLRQNAPPTFEIKRVGKKTKYRWTHCVRKYNAPVLFNGKRYDCSTKWKTIKGIEDIQVHPNLYLLINEE
jgi:aminopeptidase N